MDDASVQPTMTGKNAFGCVAESVSPAGRPSRSCPIGWRRPDTTPCVADNRHVSESSPASPSSKRCLTAKIRTVCRIPLLCADGHNGDCSACGAGSRSEPAATTFCGHPPSSPGIWAHSAVFCPSRQEVRESRSSRPVERTDSLDGLSARTGLAPGAAAQPRTMDGAVSSAP